MAVCKEAKLKFSMFNHKLPTEFPMQTLRKKTSPCKHKNEPGRFLGEGVSFRAKLIGVLEVPEARGDRMCQEALADLKMAIRAAGEHKQRIQVHVAIDGLRLRDDKTGDSLYHHPVHKISFIAQDMTDSRAFGYIFGSPDTGHRFFGIKTDKAASQVVIAMRDLFQVVFELKKKEVELAKQQLEGKSGPTIPRHTVSICTTQQKLKSITSVGETSSSTPKGAENAEGGVAELVDLEQELCSLRRGLTQVEGLTPSTDPFGDSFILPPQSQKGLLPPPPSGSSTRGRNTPAARVFSPNKATLPFDLTNVTSEYDPPTSLVDNVTEPVSQPGPSTAISYDVFTELDPLGTGRSKPYVDKKLFFQELKNPPKKVLKDLVPSLSDVRDEKEYSTTLTSLSRHSGGTVSIAKPSGYGGGLFSSDPFAETDPFDNTDPFSDTFKDDPFTNMQEFPKALKTEEFSSKRSVEKESENGLDAVVKNVFNGPLQVTLPPEPTPRSPRLQRQTTDSSTVRQRPQRIGKLQSDSASPPPPLPPKKTSDVTGRPPPRPPHDEEEGPPLPRPVRKKEPLADRSTKPRLSSAATNSSEDEYLTPAPPPLPNARRFDITLSQLLVCTMPELAHRLRVPEATLSSMTLPQLTEYLRSYLAADNERAHIHIDHSLVRKVDKGASKTPLPSNNIPRDKPVSVPVKEFKPQFEDNFTPTGGSEFVANFEDFDKKANSSYDRYAAFREIQELELKNKSILDPINSPKEDSKPDSDEKEELAAINIMAADEDRELDVKEMSRSPLKSLDELTLDSFNMFRNSVSPKLTQIDAKIKDIKSVMKNLKIDGSRRSVSPRENSSDVKVDDNDRYAALREITITEPPQDEFESLPPDVPKERKKSDEKSDGFDNSDFFDCIDNSSLSFSHVEDAFRKSPVVKEIEDRKVEEKKEIEVEVAPARDLAPPARLSTGSISDVASASSPDTKVVTSGGAVPLGARWAALPRSAGSSDSHSPPRRRRHHPHSQHTHHVQTSSSSRSPSPWDEEPPPRLPRAPPPRPPHSRHNSSGSRECLDSGSGREKDKRDKRDRERDISRDSRESRDMRDSGSGRDRRDVSNERDHRHRRSRERDDDWERDRNYARDYRDSRSRDRSKDYREKDSRHRKPRHSYDEDEDYSDGAGSGRSSPRWPDARRRRDERNYGSLGWRESRRRNDVRQIEDTTDRRYGSTLGWPARRSSSRRDSDRERDVRDPRDSRDSRDSRESRDSRDSRRRTRREEREAQRRPRDYRFCPEFSPRCRESESPFDEFQEPAAAVAAKKRAPYASLEATRFSFSEEPTGSPLSCSSARAGRDTDSTQRFRFDSDSISPRSMFEDDFATITAPRQRAASIAEEEESDVPPLRTTKAQHRDIKKSESVNIFTREADPFENDAFFACTGSDKAARRENWPGDFQGFDNA